MRLIENTAAEFDYEICNERMRPIAEALISKYRELQHIQADKILFVLNYKNSGNKRQMVLAKTSRISPKWTEILYQLGSYSYFHTIEIYAKTTASMDENQKIALLYRELRRIGPEGEILVPYVHDWWQVLMGLGRNWFYPEQPCPNLLDEGIDWKKLMAQYYEQPENN